MNNTFFGGLEWAITSSSEITKKLKVFGLIISTSLIRDFIYPYFSLNVNSYRPHQIQSKMVWDHDSESYEDVGIDDWWILVWCWLFLGDVGAAMFGAVLVVGGSAIERVEDGKEKCVCSLCSDVVLIRVKVVTIKFRRHTYIELYCILKYEAFGIGAVGAFW